MISQLKASIKAMTEDQLMAALYRDTLTGAYNRVAYERVLSDAVAIVDLDSLKYINDTYGHRAGDNKLRELSDSLRAVFGDDNVFRLSGDEFVVTGVHMPELREQLATLQDAIGTFSFGIGATLEVADEIELQLNKHQREANGLRAKRGERPCWVH